jgi:hypothetical protein
MERIKTEKIKFNVKDIEALIKNHLREIEHVDEDTGQFEIIWSPDYDVNRGATIVEVVSKHAVATGPLE